MERKKFYQNEIIRKRVGEFCGADGFYPEKFTTHYVVGFGKQLAREGYERPVIVTENAQMPGLMDKGLDLFRSIDDTKRLIMVFDIEYFDLSSLKKMYFDQVKYFNLMEPAYRKLLELYRYYGLNTYADTTTSGYHFITSVQNNSDSFESIAKLGFLENSLKEKYAVSDPYDIKRLRPTDEKYARAYSGAGRLLEFLTYRVIKECRSEIPVTVADAPTGDKKYPREGLSLDLTQYSDPVFMRPIRISFTTHQKHKLDPHRLGGSGENFPVYFCVPRNNLTVEELFEVRRDPAQAVRYAEKNSAAIPVTEDISRLVSDYLKSPVYSFHREFDRDYIRNESRQIDMEKLPPCLRKLFYRPNPELLKPVNLQVLTVYLAGKGFSPAEISRNIAKYYSEDYGWHINWRKYDYNQRANFWVRIYYGFLKTGVFDKSLFNCAAQRRKGACPDPNCGQKLNAYAG